MRILIWFLLISSCISSSAQSLHTETAIQLKDKGLENLAAYEMLKDLTMNVGHRLSGSVGYEKAVIWGREALWKAGADSVWLEPVMVPRWVRGNVERAHVQTKKGKLELTICALGGTIGTGGKSITGGVIEVRSLEELQDLGKRANGKIIFFNRPFDKTKLNTGEAYGGAVFQRSSGAIEAAKVGAIGVLVRSMTNAIDDVPHTGAMGYADSVPKIPAAAISTLDANLLSAIIKEEGSVTVSVELSARKYDDVQSFNVIGEIRGTEHPEEVIVVSGHLDSWDKGTGAHDDGSGIVQSIEVLNLISTLPAKPKRTIRAVLFANEENGLKGGKAYSVRAANSKEKHIAAIESDAGGFQPRSFGVSADSSVFEKILNYLQPLTIAGIEKIEKGGGGADISQLKKFGTALIGLDPKSQRYFDYHHSNHDTIDKVHPRELELGAIAMSILAWAIAEDGL
ncbi:MAG: M28 family peptidase [Bacteroidota bacterium]